MTAFVLVFLGSIAANLVLLGGAAILASVDSEHAVQEKYFSHSHRAANKVAIINVDGLITENNKGFVKRQIEHVIADKHVKAVVLHVNSPGGTISGSDYIYHHLREMLEKRQIPMVVSMGGLAASGGYYVSMAVGNRPAPSMPSEPPSPAGSADHPPLRSLQAAGQGRRGGRLDHQRTVEGHGQLRPAHDRKRTKRFKALVDDGLARFKEVPVRPARTHFGQAGRTGHRKIFTAEKAKAHLVDKIGFLEDAVAGAIELAKLDPQDVTVVHYKPEGGLAALFMGSEGRSRQGLDLHALLDMTSPRAYYLCTWLPALAEGER